VKAHCPKCKGSWRGDEAAIHTGRWQGLPGQGYICEAGRVELNGAPETPDSHILTPTWPVSVICQLNGEVVEKERVHEEEFKS